MKKASRTRRKNTIHRDADYPLRGWIDPQTGQRFSTVTLRLDDGRYLSAIDIDPSIRRTAATKEKAERAAIDAYDKQARSANPVADRDKTAVRFGPITIEVEWDDEARCYASFSPDINVASAGYTAAEAIEMFKDALRGHLETSKQLGLRLGISAAKVRELEKRLAA